MALIFCDGFDHYTNLNKYIEAEFKWTFANTNTFYTSSGRRLNSISVQTDMNNIANKNFSSTINPIIFGFAFKLNGFPAYGPYGFNGIYFYPHFYFRLDPDLKVIISTSVGQTVTPIYQSTNPLNISLDTWYYLEIKITIGNPGVFIVRLDETEVINETTLNLINSSYPSVIGLDRLGIRSINGNQNTFFDDLYICDTSGTENNDFLGDVRIDTILPNADGNSSEFTPSAGANYECVDDTEINETDYVESNIPDTKDLYQFPDIENTNTNILAVVQNIICKKSDAASDRKLLPVNRYSSIDTEIGTGEAINGVDYKNIQVIMEKNPLLNVNWIESHVNNSEFGFKIYDGHFVKVNDNTHTYSAMGTSGGVDFDPSKVADGDMVTYWYSFAVFTGPSWLKIDFGSGNAKIIQKIITKQPTGYNNNIWLNFAIDGSNDNSIWNTIYNATSVADQQFREWTFNNSIAYRYWRLYYPDSYGLITGNYILIAEWELYELQQS
jgi:hypothetical protein